MSLLEDLRTVAATSLQGSELPTHVEVQDLLGAVVKTLDAAGVTVAADLLPKPAAAVADAAIEAAEPVADTGVNELLAKIQELEAKLEGKSQNSSGATATVVTGGGSKPADPPIEGAS
jgi:hypothetical protein